MGAVAIHIHAVVAELDVADQYLHAREPFVVGFCLVGLGELDLGVRWLPFLLLGLGRSKCNDSHRDDGHQDCTSSGNESMDADFHLAGVILLSNLHI